jgi:hypothetical protein
VRAERLDDRQWAALEGGKAFLATLVVFFRNKFTAMVGALALHGRTSSLRLSKALVAWLTAEAPEGPPGSRQRTVYPLMQRLSVDWEFFRMPDHELDDRLKVITDKADAGLSHMPRFDAESEGSTGGAGREQAASRKVACGSRCVGAVGGAAILDQG